MAGSELQALTSSRRTSGQGVKDALTSSAAGGEGITLALDFPPRLSRRGRAGRLERMDSIILRRDPWCTTLQSLLLRGTSSDDSSSSGASWTASSRRAEG